MEFRNQGKTKHTFLATVLVALVLQAAIAPQISILGGRVNFMAVLAGVTALSGDSRKAVYTGFLAGLFYDFSAAVPVGVMTLLLSVGSYVLAQAAGTAMGGFSSLSVQMLATFVTIVSLLNGVILVIMGSEGSILIGIFGHGIASAVLTSLAGVLFLMFQGRGDSHGGFEIHSSGKRFKDVR